MDFEIFEFRVPLIFFVTVTLSENLEQSITANQPRPTGNPGMHLFRLIGEKKLVSR
jgi:hypothetical protein